MPPLVLDFEHCPDALLVGWKVSWTVIRALVSAVENGLMKKDIRFLSRALRIARLVECTDEPMQMLLVIRKRVTPHRKALPKPPETVK